MSNKMIKAHKHWLVAIYCLQYSLNINIGVIRKENAVVKALYLTRNVKYLMVVCIYERERERSFELC